MGRKASAQARLGGTRGHSSTRTAMVRRFHFHLVKSGLRITDRVGMELDQDRINSPSILEAVAQRWPGTLDDALWQGWSVDIVDEDGHTVRTIALTAPR